MGIFAHNHHGIVIIYRPLISYAAHNYPSASVTISISSKLDLYQITTMLNVPSSMYQLSNLF
jgi:hypothetical protein